MLVGFEPGLGSWKVILSHTDLGSRSAHAHQRVDVELVGNRWNALFHQLVGDELRLGGIACCVAFDKIREGCPCEVCKGIIEVGSLGKLLIWDRIGFIGGDEVWVFDAIGSRPAGPADLKRVIDSWIGTLGIATWFWAPPCVSRRWDHSLIIPRTEEKPDHPGCTPQVVSVGRRSANQNPSRSTTSPTVTGMSVLNSGHR